MISSMMVAKVLKRNATHVDSPEGELLLAVIHQAIVDHNTTTLLKVGKEFVKRNGKFVKRQPFFRETTNFFNSEWFAHLCDLIGLNSVMAREVIEKAHSLSKSDEFEYVRD